MKPRGHVREFRPSDLQSLTSDMREADVAEIKASSGASPKDAIEFAHSSGNLMKVACLHDDTPVALYGVNPVSPTLGAVWMVATNSFSKLHWQFLREGHQELSRLGEGYQVLFNYTDARNKLHHRWISWMGFTFISKKIRGPENREFLEFVKIMDN